MKEKEILITEGVKPCPMCGSAAQIKRGMFGGVYVACECSLHTFFRAEEDPLKTLERWNKRAGEDA